MTDTHCIAKNSTVPSPTVALLYRQDLDTFYLHTLHKFKILSNLAEAATSGEMCQTSLA